MRPGWTTLLMALILAFAPVARASTTWYVDGVNGSDNNDCKSPTTACQSIGHAISLAASGDSIRVAAATYTENLTIGISLKLMGASAATTIIDGGAVNTVVTISTTGTHVSLSKFTMRGGAGNRGGGINNIGNLAVNNCIISGNAAAGGGGIYNKDTLIINNTTITGNSTSFKFGGGGILNVGELTVNDTTINNNSSSSAVGGGINNGGELTVNNTTITGNSATYVRCFHVFECGGQGGGIYNKGTLVINNTTITSNSANNTSPGSGIFNYIGGTTLQNSIVADNPGGNCSGTITSNGYNLSSDSTCNFTGPGDLNNTEPMLGPLQNNGGPTQTQALLSGSPAIDAGNPSGCTDSTGHLLKTDQRGMPRPDKEDSVGCDMGAYERQSD